jgi:hypothetical protein
MGVMRWSLAAVRLCMIIVTVITALIILLSTVPLATGGLDFDFPDDNDDLWQMNGNVVSAEIPVGIYNGGYFDIEDFVFRVNLTDVDGYPLAISESDPVDLKAGEWTEVILGISFDLDDLPAEKQFEIVFNGTEATMGLGIDASFGLKTMDLSIDVDSGDETMDIPPMITEMNIDPSDLDLVDTGSGYELQLPYSFSASDMIIGKQLSLFMSISNQTENIGNDSTAITVDQYNEGVLTFPISQEMYDHLLAEPDTFTVDTRVTFLGITMGKEITYQWSPFVNNLDIHGMNVYYTGTDGMMELFYGFDAAPSVQGKYVSVNITVTDSVGKVTKGTEHLYLQTDNEGDSSLVVPAAAMTRLLGDSDELTITFVIHGTGVDATMTTTYTYNGGN